MSDSEDSDDGRLNCSVQLTLDENNNYWLLRYDIAPNFETTVVVRRLDREALGAALEKVAELWAGEEKRQKAIEARLEEIFVPWDDDAE